VRRLVLIELGWNQRIGMTEYHLIVSNPPHRSPDPKAAAQQLGMSAAEVRMKLNFAAPEVWLAETDKDAAREAATALNGAGVNVAWIPGSVLAAVPGVLATSEVFLDSERVVLGSSAGELTIESGHRVVAVLGEPVQQETRPTSGAQSVLTQKVPGRGPVRNLPFVSNIAIGIGGVAGYKAIDKLDKMAADAKDSAGTRLSGTKSVDPVEVFLDVYALGDGGWRATRLAPSLTDFSGLGERKQATGRANIGAVVEMLEEVYGARVDKRLLKVAYKPAVVSGVALIQVLRSISERLATLPLMDVGSALAFLTSKG
jgi:hypothetical protein